MDSEVSDLYAMADICGLRRIVLRCPDDELGPRVLSIRAHRNAAWSAFLDSCMEVDIDGCAEQLGSAAVDIIVFGSTAGSLISGAGYDIAVRVSRVVNATALVESRRLRRRARCWRRLPRSG